jgi:hypothetical protein
MEGCSPEQPNLPFLEGNAPALPKNWRARLLPSRILSSNREIGKSASRETAAIGEWRVANGERKTSTRNTQPNFTLYALRITLNSQPNFGANAPPTCHFYALRITLYASNSQL